MKSCAICRDKVQEDEGRIDEKGRFVCLPCADETDEKTEDGVCPECGEQTEEFAEEKVCPVCGAENQETDEDDSDEDE